MSCDKHIHAMSLLTSLPSPILSSMSHLSRPEFILYHLTPHLYNPKRLPAKALKKLNLPLRRCKFFSRMLSPASSHSSTLYNGSGPSSPGQQSGYSSGSDMHIDSPPTALRARIAPPRPSGRPSTPPWNAPSVQLHFESRDDSPPPLLIQLVSCLPCTLAGTMVPPVLRKYLFFQ